jgi:hypothetical protein
MKKEQLSRWYGREIYQEEDAMLNVTKSYVKIWELEDNGKYIQAKVGSSRKDKRDGTWINSHWFARFVGKCADQARALSKGDRIMITNGTVESVYSKERQRAYTSLTIFEFEQEQQQPQWEEFEIDDSELPF